MALQWVLDLSTNPIRLLGLNGRKVVAFQEVVLPESAFHAGRLIGPAVAGEAVKAALQQAGYRVRRPAIVLGPQVAVEMQMSLPVRIRAGDIAGAVQAQAERLLGGRTEDYVLRWTQVRKGQLSRVLYVVAARADVVQAVKQFAAAGGFPEVRTVPFFLALRMLVSENPGVLIAAREDGQVLALGVEHGFPAVSGAVGWSPMPEGSEASVAAALHKTLHAAGPYSGLPGMRQLSVLGYDLQLTQGLQYAGYSVVGTERPSSWPADGTLGGTGRLSWPQAALAWGAGLTAFGPGRQIDLTSDTRRRLLTLRTVGLLLLISLLLGEIGAAVYGEVAYWPERRAAAAAVLVAAQAERAGIGLDEQKVQLYQSLVKQSDALTGQNQALTTPQLDWGRLYTALWSVLPNSGVSVQSVTPDAAPKSDPKKEADKKTPAGEGADPLRPILTLVGSASSEAALGAFVEALGKEPFSRPVVTRVQIQAQAPAPVARPATIAPPSTPRQAGPAVTAAPVGSYAFTIRVRYDERGGGQP